MHSTKNDSFQCVEDRIFLQLESGQFGNEIYGESGCCFYLLFAYGYSIVKRIIILKELLNNNAI